jgi:predicted small metal-binding protein
VNAVHCPCGQVFEAETDDELVEQVQAHVQEDHRDLVQEYTREKILSMATSTRRGGRSCTHA